MGTRPSAFERGYTYRWQKARLVYLRSNPLCVMCLRLGRTSAAIIVDHIKRHQGKTNPEFWNPTNWQSLCARCHNSTKQQIDRKGWARGHGVDGWRLDDASP